MCTVLLYAKLKILAHEFPRIGVASAEHEVHFGASGAEGERNACGQQVCQHNLGWKSEKQKFARRRRSISNSRGELDFTHLMNLFKQGA